MHQIFKEMSKNNFSGGCLTGSITDPSTSSFHKVSGMDAFYPPPPTGFPPVIQSQASLMPDNGSCLSDKSIPVTTRITVNIFLNGPCHSGHSILNGEGRGMKFSSMLF